MPLINKAHDPPKVIIFQKLLYILYGFSVFWAFPKFIFVYVPVSHCMFWLLICVTLNGILGGNHPHPLKSSSVYVTGDKSDTGLTSFMASVVGQTIGTYYVDKTRRSFRLNTYGANSDIGI